MSPHLHRQYAGKSNSRSSSPRRASPISVRRGTSGAVGPEGYHTLLCATDGLVEQEAAFLSELVRRRVDGVAIVTLAYQMDVLQRELRGTPAVLTCVPDLPIANADYVAFDEVRAARMAVDYLAQCGRRRIATITGPPIFPAAPLLKGGESLAASLRRGHDGRRCAWLSLPLGYHAPVTAEGVPLCPFPLTISSASMPVCSAS